MTFEPKPFIIGTLFIVASGLTSGTLSYLLFGIGFVFVAGGLLPQASPSGGRRRQETGRGKPTVLEPWAPDTPTNEDSDRGFAAFLVSRGMAVSTRCAEEYVTGDRADPIFRGLFQENVLTLFLAMIVASLRWHHVSKYEELIFSELQAHFSHAAQDQREQTLSNIRRLADGLEAHAAPTDLPETRAIWAELSQQALLEYHSHVLGPDHGPEIIDVASVAARLQAQLDPLERSIRARATA